MSGLLPESHVVLPASGGPDQGACKPRASPARIGGRSAARVRRRRAGTSYRDAAAGNARATIRREPSDSRGAAQPARKPAHGGRPFIVGGAVRDALLDLPVKDYDIEVFGLPAEALKAALTPLGSVNAVGEAFTVFKLAGLEGVEGAADV